MESREHLLHLLAEAAELEHNILCSYLYAVFSLKEREDEGLDPKELAVVAGWRKTLMGLCVEEMVHLAQVCNLMVALGSRPHLNRPNLPTPPGYHPSKITLGLSPFNGETLDHFIFLERPEQANIEDAEPFGKAPGATVRLPPQFPPLMPRAPDYNTIGEFYTDLRQRFADLANQMGEDRLFVGDAALQIQAAEIGAKVLVVVQDLSGANKAIDFIVEQGEGSRGARDESHYGKFMAIKAGMDRLTAARAEFQACRDAACNPVMHPAVEPGRIHIDGEQAAPVLDAANSAYALMLRCLSAVYEVPASEGTLRSALLEGAMVAMKLVSGLGVALTELPAQDQGSTRASISFAMLRSVEGPLRGREAEFLGERFVALASRLPKLGLTNDVQRSLVEAVLGASLTRWAKEGRSSEG
ncbi:MAG TPA: ferritin-like protein [Polaromonas sp.]|uniref:ferritin-like domain-containing protein n=1 Tax=Polaromonas sp. TaxID=1869339 RepID=UPI002D3CA321|nr:ferritin-like protein [Polaromonas sp.]HYW57150.1 ferritin-like protein [Polaromonas sp.]